LRHGLTLELATPQDQLQTAAKLSEDGYITTILKHLPKLQLHALPMSVLLANIALLMPHKVKLWMIFLKLSFATLLVWTEIGAPVSNLLMELVKFMTS
jgi:hypothetical protein